MPIDLEYIYIVLFRNCVNLCMRVPVLQYTVYNIIQIGYNYSFATTLFCRFKWHDEFLLFKLTVIIYIYILGQNNLFF